MTLNNSEQLFCSVDLEFTGFDPFRDQILEIGFAFFKVSDQGLQIVEQWEQVFKPSIEVHPKILGLTGISQEELDVAPEFKECKEFLQKKLGDAIIVGHNPVMDIKFLEAYGLKLSGQVVDTLELVQFILPTHHSYNLENLVHYFGIQHDGDHHAHRALADALATISVLENLMHLYQQFPSKLKQELQEVTDKGNFIWQSFFGYKWPKKQTQSNDSLHQVAGLEKLEPLNLSTDLITIDAKAFEHEVRVALGLQNENQPCVLAVQNPNTVMRLWKAGLVHGVFNSDSTFSKSAFNTFLDRAKTNEELRFCLKVIVWLRTNWQKEVVLDLNISFFGGQYKGAITGGKPKITSGKTLCVDYETLNDFNGDNHHLVICDIQNFERHMSNGLGGRLGWGGLMYALKMIYNPENELGNPDLKNEVVTALAGVDLFFGLTYMLLHASLAGREYVTQEELSGNHEHIFKRLKGSADNLKEKLAIVQKKSKSPELARSMQFLTAFFMPESNRVKWVNIDEYNLAFFDQPLDISENVHQILNGFSDVKFTETFTNRSLLSYYVDRLGLNTEVSEFPNKLIPNKVNIIAKKNTLSPDELFKITVGTALPMVIIFQNQAEIKNFYNLHYREIKKSAALFAQGYSGGGNKMFRNFSINENSILLVTAEFMAKQNYKISSQTIIIVDLPVVESEHPYISALLAHWEKPYPDLLTLLASAKLTEALKKLNYNNSVSVFLYNSPFNNFFVDNQR